MSKNVVGIDKLVLTSKEFILPDMPKMKLIPKNELGVEPNVRDDLIVKTASGVPIYGSRLYKDSRLLETCSNVGISKHGLQVTFNPNKHYHPYHAYSDVGKLKDSLSLISQELKSIGILVDTTRMKVYRIDTNQDQEMSKSYSEYKPIYDALGATRMKATRYTTGVRIKSKSVEQVFYDKGQDQLNRTGEIIPEINLMRSEARLTNTRSVKKNTGDYLSNVENILKYYDYIEKVHFGQVKKILSGLHDDYKVDQKEMQFYQDRQAFETILNNGKRNTLMEFFSIFGGIDYVIKNYKTVEFFETQIIDQLSIHRQAKKRLKAKLRELATKNKFMVKQIDENRKQMDLLKDEIITKFSKSA